ncbi:MAG: hypothetical protein ACOCZ7_04390, partial [Armatimonadota bacterium]
MYLLYTSWGHDGLMALRVLVAGIGAALLAWLCLRRGGAPIAVMAAGALAIFAARPLFNDRPQAVTVPFFVAMLCLIQLAEEGKERWLLIGAPLLMIVWVNIHGGFIYGPALMGLYAFCKLPGWYRQWREDADLSPRPGYVAGAIGLTVVACLVNPNGLEGAIYPLGYVGGGHTWHQTAIAEYASPDFSEGVFLPLGCLIVTAMAAFAASGRRASLWDVALTAVFLYTTLKWQRNMALFAFAVAPVFALHLSGLLERLTSAIRQPASGSRDSALLHWAIVVVLAVSAIMSFPAASRQTDEAFRNDMPVECV